MNADQVVLVEEDTPAAKIYLCMYLLALILHGPHTIRLLGPPREGRRDGGDSSQDDWTSTATESQSEVFFPAVSHGVDLILADDSHALGVRTFSFVVGGRPLKVDVKSTSTDDSESITLRIHGADDSVSDAEKLVSSYTELIWSGPQSIKDDPSRRWPKGGCTFLCPASNRKLRRKRLLAKAPFQLMFLAWYGWWAALACSAYRYRGLSNRFGAVGIGASALLGLIIAKAGLGCLKAYFHPELFADRSQMQSPRGGAVRIGVGLVKLLIGVAALGGLVEWAAGPNREFGTLGWSVKATVVAAGMLVVLVGYIAGFTRWLRGSEQSDVRA